MTTAPGFLDRQAETAGTQDHSQARLVGEATTLMFRHLPRKYTVRNLLSALEQFVDRSALDFVYVPWDRKSTNNMGFAFVNCADAASARKIATVMQGSLCPNDSRMREMKIMPAIVQGFAANLLRYHETIKEPDPAHSPLIFNKGKQVPLNFAIQWVMRPQTCGTWGKVQVSTSGIGSAAGAGKMPLESALPPLPTGLVGARSQGGGAGGSGHLSRASTSCWTMTTPSAPPGPLLASGDVHRAQRYTTEFPEQTKVHVSGRSLVASSVDFFEDVAPALSSAASSLTAECFDTVRMTPEYAAAWLQVVTLLRKLQQLGAF